MAYRNTQATVVAAVAGLAMAGCGTSDDLRSQEVVAENDPAAQSPQAAEAVADSLIEQYAVLAHRQALIADASEIKRLQRAYGYYLDQGRWSEAASLFADDGTLEIGLDGVFAGPERVAAYLAAAYGAGADGLSEGRLNEHFQLMPVVTVAADGQTARGRWRDLMLLGQYGEAAFWGEGPFENEYVKVDGVWKIAKAHWYQSMLVPYESGWQANEDANGGRWIESSLQADSPTSVDYETWPGTYLPPFHFPNPVMGATASLAAVSAAAPAADFSGSVDDFENAIGRLEAEISRLEDEDAIENLQRIYGFYIDKGFWSEAAALFADSGTIEYGDSGVYEGRERVLEYLKTWGSEFPSEGRLFEHMQLQPVVHVGPDGSTAEGRWHLFSQEAQYGEFARWGTGVHENTYVKVDGRWLIQDMHVYPTMVANYEEGWAISALEDPGASAAVPPDRPPSVSHSRYPGRIAAPFHFAQPGYQDVAIADAEFGATISSDEHGERLDEFEHRLTRLEDFDALERLNAIYGYYLARNEWDNFTGIFADEGTIEIALRGVYSGLASVRRNLNLYGEAGIHHGLLHNHMQYQPVITLAEDGMSARMRSRAFSIMGEHETYSMWMGGVYENRFVKEEGIWKLYKDQVFNTYFVPYSLGWKDAPRRPPPGISQANPPDAPPTVAFELYPSAFLPPFHYVNPVTGQPVSMEPDR